MRYFLLVLTFAVLSCSSEKSSVLEITKVFSTKYIGSIDNDYASELSGFETENNSVNYSKYVQDLLDKSENGQFAIFDPLDKESKLSKDEIEELFNITEEIELELENGEKHVKTIHSKLNSDYISHLTFEENWTIYDDGSVKKEIIRIALHKQSFDQLGSYRGRLTLFWIEF